MTLTEGFIHWTRRFHRAHEQWADDQLRDQLKWSFRQACIGAGVAIAVDAPVAGTGWRTPEITHITTGPPVRFTARMCEGQVPAALIKAGPLIAPHLGGMALRVADRGHGWAVVTVLTEDPLKATLDLDLEDAEPHVLIGRDEGGDEIRVDPVDLPHLIVQGQTRSGKSVWLYGFLVQAVRWGRVTIAGVDPSGITLRPFAGTRHARWQALGLADVAGIDRTVAELVAEMDRRLAAMPDDHDILDVDDDNPLIIGVFDEYPALLRAVDSVDKDAGKRIRSGIARLLAESHKVGFRLIVAAQRAEASIVGAAERAQCGGRLSFRVDSADSVKLLHSDAEAYAPGHTSAPPGIALCSWPGRPLTRIRGPFIGGYSAFCAAIRAACADDPTTN